MSVLCQERKLGGWLWAVWPIFLQISFSVRRNEVGIGGSQKYGMVVTFDDLPPFLQDVYSKKRTAVTRIVKHRGTNGPMYYVGNMWLCYELWTKKPGFNQDWEYTGIIEGLGC